LGAGSGDPASVSGSAPPSANDNDAGLEIRFGLHVCILLSLDQAQNQTEIAHRQSAGANVKKGVRICLPKMSAGSSPREAVTRLLVEWKGGNSDARDLLTPIVYDELRRLADRYLRNEREAATLQPTALVHELYLRLVAQNLPDWESRSHFFGVAAHLMRQILVDHARRKRSAKRGSGATKVPIEDVVTFAPGCERVIEALDDALNALAVVDPRKAKVIELRFFGGFSVDETGQSLGISVATVGREQRLAEAWLHREMSAGPGARKAPSGES
jgi:RNA polymerase sigma-70 factor, ECF subfamily